MEATIKKPRKFKQLSNSTKRAILTSIKNGEKKVIWLKNLK